MIFTRHLICAAAVCFVAFNVQAQSLKETIFKAMQDEQFRSMENLSVGDLPRPYNIEYLLTIRKHKAHMLY